MFLGIEIGGTKLQLGLGAGDGTLAALWRGAVTPAEGADGIRRQIVQAVPELLANAGLAGDQLLGVGVGFGGPVDDRTRAVIKSHQIEGWDGFPLADWVGDLLGLPAVLGNDADVAGLAEALFGAGKGLSPVFYVTIGSGIGGGLIVDGEVYRGVGRGAAEIGHLRVPITRGSVWSLVPLELEASGWAIQERGRWWLNSMGAVDGASEPWSRYPEKEREFWNHLAGNPTNLTAKYVAEAAQQGSKAAQHLLRRAWCSLAEALVSVITLLCPRRIVIGGGVALMGEELLFAPLRELVAERMFKPFADCCDIVPAALGEEVVVHGALALARKRLTGPQAPG